MTWRPDTPRRALERARAELLRDAARSDQLIAAGIACSTSPVSAARRQLEAAGDDAGGRILRVRNDG